MKVAEYKGYEIGFYEHSGQFSIEGIEGWFDKFKDATDRIDRVLKAESKEGCPIDVVISHMKTGKVTSYNKFEKTAWFTPDEKTGRERTKERMADYAHNPRFYKPNEHNLQAIRMYAGLTSEIAKMENEKRNLEKSLTEPITFDASEG